MKRIAAHAPTKLAGDNYLAEHVTMGEDENTVTLVTAATREHETAKDGDTSGLTFNRGGGWRALVRWRIEYARNLCTYGQTKTIY